MALTKCLGDALKIEDWQSCTQLLTSGVEIFPPETLMTTKETLLGTAIASFLRVAGTPEEMNKALTTLRALCDVVIEKKVLEGVTPMTEQLPRLMTLVRFMGTNKSTMKADDFPALEFARHKLADKNGLFYKQVNLFAAGAHMIKTLAEVSNRHAKDKVQQLILKGALDEAKDLAAPDVTALVQTKPHVTLLHPAGGWQKLQLAFPQATTNASKQFSEIHKAIIDYVVAKQEQLAASIMAAFDELTKAAIEANAKVGDAWGR